MNTQTDNAVHRNNVNGVDVNALFDTINAVKANTTLADSQFRATNRWMDGGHNRSTIQSFRSCGQEDTSRNRPFIMDADEPEVLLGSDQGANPVEYVLHALAACMTTTVIYHAAARGIAIRGMHSALEGDLDLRGFLGLSDEVRRGYQVIRVRMTVDCDAEPEALAELVRYSPVYDMVSRSLPVEVRFCRA
ncbi:putative OsmC-like protein [Natronocella acetinitrilica]|uniref:OsmC-like protein n=1 Tax=Natronocella acetinitrilica TaxID=414046 RepID=A0AAE3G783_9GAMM|nr:OsmC family protein [Natronocella acetinitrilica]MCP1677116.1 putative OsmC-like protein [Natronocella acetinitrilica]